jgi:hypothetical protein
MTARLVTQVGRRDYKQFSGRPGFPLHPGPVGGDRMLPMLWRVYGRPVGQLWARVAEGRVR